MNTNHLDHPLTITVSNMGSLDQNKLEEYFDQNPELVQEYFLKRADLTLVNKWLVSHGFHTVNDYVAGRRGSMSQESSGPASPNVAMTDSGFFSDKDAKHIRTNSKKHLRHDFARSKMRSMFRTCEPSVSPSSNTLEARRSSLKGMRQFKSLPATNINMLSMLIESKVRLPRYASKDEDYKRELRHSNEREFFLEIVKDISNDLDLNGLAGKIRTNIEILCDCDRSTLYLIEGPKGHEALVSKSCDSFQDYLGSDLFVRSNHGHRSNKVPLGKGIVGFVGETGRTVNLEHAHEDPRYNETIDLIGDEQSHSLLCMPIKNADDQVIGVAEVMHKIRNGSIFTKDDEKIFETYLTFCGIAIQNAMIFDAYSKEYERNKELLEVVHDLFEEQTSVDAVVSKIMQRAQSLLKCECCSMLLKDMTDTENIVFTKAFDLCQSNNGDVTQRYLTPSYRFHPSRPAQGFVCNKRASTRIYDKLAEIVASTGETVNMSDTAGDSRFDLSSERANGVQAKSLLCKPIRNPDFQTIGVAKVINRLDGKPFDELDDQLFEAFTIFCGLGINNCLLYDEVSRAAARQAVALEVLSYHAAISVEEVQRFKRAKIPEVSSWHLTELTFNDFSLDLDEMIIASIRIFMDAGLINAYKIEYETLCRWLLTVRKNYRQVAYHNWRHAFNVCQVMFTILKSTQTESSGFLSIITNAEALALIVGCLCHDLDHRGTNNAFQQKSSSALAQLYGTKATLEHHHFNHAIMILNSEGHNIFGNIPADEYKEVMRLLKHSILATDLSLHFPVRDKFIKLVENWPSSSRWETRDEKDIVRSVLMTACDIACITKPWDVQRKAADLVMTEFFDQGDKEKKELKIQPTPLMDRERQDELPQLQLGWIDGICLPLYKALSKMDKYFEHMLNGVMENRRQWETLERRRKIPKIVRETGV